MRLGKVERFILCWAYEQHRNYAFFAKSNVLLSYARRHHRIKLVNPSNIKAQMPSGLYNTLHVCFSRALRSLARKSLIEYVLIPDAEDLKAIAKAMKEVKLDMRDWLAGNDRLSMTLRTLSEQGRIRYISRPQRVTLGPLQPRGVRFCVRRRLTRNGRRYKTTRCSLFKLTKEGRSHAASIQRQAKHLR
jgi:hypothetical protein